MTLSNGLIAAVALAYMAILFAIAFVISRAILMMIPDGALKRFLSTSVPQRDKAD
mgnify:CR=1 FL=1